MSSYAELHCLSCYSFLRSASHPHELVERAAALGYRALAITDECSFAGIVKAHVAAKEAGIQLIIGSELILEEGIRLVVLVPTRDAYSELSGLISMARRRSPKGEYRVTLRDVIFHLKRCLLIWLPQVNDENSRAYGLQLKRLCKGRLWLGVNHLLGNNEVQRYLTLQQLAQALDIPMLACGDVRMHTAKRKPLHDVFTALYHGTSIAQLGRRRLGNSQQHLRTIDKLQWLYPP
ncbi:MAG: PHP domain-containing protein, partial [Halioglobus sp.]